MIPKIIHYCWFGGKPLPELAQKCIASWKKYCPDYEIKEWNEQNFDLNCCDYVREAYEAGKWAFVSDFARLKIAYEHGGIYFDTDVELVRPVDDLLSLRCFLGMETSGYVNTGLGFGAEKHSEVISKLMAEYTDRHFRMAENCYDFTPCPHMNTVPLTAMGYAYSATQIWKNALVTVYPPEYFCPKSYETGRIMLTANTYSIHHFTASWHDKISHVIHLEEQTCNRILGEKYGRKIGRFLSLPLRIVKKIKDVGLAKSFKLVREKLYPKN